MLTRELITGFGHRSLLLAIAGSLSLQACAILPEGLGQYSLNQLPQWLQSRNDNNLQQSPTTQAPIEFKTERWWRAANDDALSLLIEEALKDSSGARVAAARTNAALAQLGVYKADLLPQVGAKVEINKQELSKNYYVPPSFAGRPLELGQGAVSVNWDLDLWGRQQKAIESINGKVQAAQAEQAMVALQLSSQIAKTYVQLRWIRDHLAELQTMLTAHQAMVDLQTTRLSLGLDNGSGVDRAKDAMSQTALLMEQAKGQQSRLLAALESLVGNRELMAQALAKMPAGLPGPLLAYDDKQPLPLALLARRPDLVGSRFMVQAAASEVDATRLSALPNINLTGYLGSQAIGWSKLTDRDSRIALLGGVLEFPIFEGGKIRFATQAKKAEFEALKAQYEGSISNAAQEVINEVLLLKQINQEVAVQQERLGTLQRQAERAEQRRALGIDSAIPALDAKIALSGQRIRVLETQLKALGNQVDLVLALGGGYENKQVMQQLSAVDNTK